MIGMIKGLDAVLPGLGVVSRSRSCIGHDWPLLVDSASPVQVAVLRLGARDPWYFPTQYWSLVPVKVIVLIA